MAFLTSCDKVRRLREEGVEVRYLVGVGWVAHVVFRRVASSEFEWMVVVVVVVGVRDGR